MIVVILGCAILATIVLMSFVGIYFGWGYAIIGNFAKSSTEITIKSVIENSLSFYLFVFLVFLLKDLLKGHFHIENTNHLIIASSLYVTLRFIAFFHSEKIAMEHINTIMFLIFVSLFANVVGYAQAWLTDPVNSPIIFPSLSANELFYFSITSLVIPIATELYLKWLDRFEFIRLYLKKNNINKEMITEQ